MRVIAEIEIDNERIYEMFRDQPMREGPLKLIDTIEDGVKRAVESIDPFAHVEVKLQ